MRVDDVYLDSSFLLKLYVLEKETASARLQVGAVTGKVFISFLTNVEVVASLSRRLSVQDGNLAKEKYQRNRLAGLFVSLDMPQSVYDLAVRIGDTEAKKFRLKSLDILHLATALHHGVPTVMTFDKDMREAALALGLSVLPA